MGMVVDLSTEVSNNHYVPKGEVMGEALVVIGVSILIFAICREIVCWYFKFNAILSTLTEIRDLLKNRSAGI